MIYLTSDLHLGHSNIMKHCKRPFNSIEEMNNRIINNINDMVRPNDELYILGDLYFGEKQTINTFEYAKKIKCEHIHLIKGNHDMSYEDLLKLNEENKVFESISLYKELKYEKRLFVLCHYPFMDNAWNKAMHGSINIHGHIHSNTNYNQEQKDKKILRYDVGVDANDYYPVLIDNILEFFKGIEPNNNDYHANYDDETID